MNRILPVLLFTFLYMASGFLSYSSAQTGDSPQVLPKGASIYQLDNGMQVLLIENPALPMIGVNVIVKTGSAYENFATSGMSHMLEHLLFNGTLTRTQKQLYDDVDRIGGYNNAHTDKFYTDYMFVVPTENIRKGMEIQADMLFNSILPEENFKKEKGIVLEEISKSLSSPQEQFGKNTNSVLYEGHALSLPTLGTYSTIESMSRDDVNGFYKNNYVPNNMILSIIGNFDTRTMLPMIKEIYGKAKPGQVIMDENTVPATGFQLPKQSIKKNSVYYRFYDGKDKVLQLFYSLPPTRSSEYFYLLSLSLEKHKDSIKALLESEFPQAVKAINLSTRTTPVSNFVDAEITFGDEVNIDKLVSFISEELTKLNFSLTPEEVKAEAVKARTDFLKNIEKPHMFGIYNSNEMVMNGIESVLSAYNGDKYYKAAQELGNLQLQPDPVVILQSPSVKETKAGSKAFRDVKFFNDETSNKNLIAVQNEMSNLLAVHYLLKHKAVYESEYGKDAAKILHDCLGQRLSSEENQRTGSQFGFTFTVNDNPMIPMDDIYLHPDFGYIRAEGLADDLTGAINYLNSEINGFIPTEEEYNKAVEKFKNLEMMTMGGDKSRKLFDKEYKSLVYEQDPYSHKQAELTYGNLLEFTKEYFNPSNMIISVVSPGSPETINSLFHFTSTSNKNEPPVFTPVLAMKDTPVTIEKAGGGERSYIFWGFTSQIDPKDAPALQALSLVLSEDIVFEIRERQGLAYNMSAGIEIIKDKALFYVSQGTRPQNIDTLSAQYPEFFRTAVLDSLTEDKIEKSVNMYLGRMMFRRLSSINQAYYLGNSQYFKDDFNYDTKFFDELKNIKLADVKNVGNKYLHIKNPMLLVIR